VRAFISYTLLRLIKLLGRTFYTLESGWIGTYDDDPWKADIRIVAILHHTSLYEPVFAGVCPNHFLRRISRLGVVPIADKTLERPIVGAFFKMIAANVVSITRKRDDTWREVVRQAGPGKMVMILPEGRMKRATGLDSDGRPMTVRGGIADLIEATGEGKMLVAYSGGLHHIQAPGDKLPKLWKPVRLNLELVDVARYRAAVHAGAEEEDSFRRAVVVDMERRRDLYSPVEGVPVGIPDPVAYAAGRQVPAPVSSRRRRRGSAGGPVPETAAAAATERADG
jgi:hypothetical protein